MCVYMYLSSYYQLRQLRVIARSLTFNAAFSLVHAFVFSRLDYCSSIFVGFPGVRMEKLKRVHRAAARLIAYGNLVIPFARSATMQTRSFAVVGPKTWNGLQVDLRHLPNGACAQFHHFLKTVLGQGRERL